MYVKSLELENIRSFRYLKIELSKNINILTGANNSGKSTIIKALYKLQNLHNLQVEDNRKGEYKSRTLIGLESISFDDFKTITREEIRIPAESKKIYIQHEVSQQAQTAHYIDVGENIVVNLSDFERSSRYNPKPFQPIPNMENQNNFIYPFFARRKNAYYSSQAGLENTYSVVEDLRNLPYKIQKIGNLSHPRNREFQKCCEDILGFNIGVVPGNGNNDIKIGIYTRGESVIPLESMGEGVANIIGLIAILLTEDNKLYLIEEIENDIHPEALKKLINLIIEKSHNNQFVISTHSNIVLKHLGSLSSTKIFYTDWRPIDTEGGSQSNMPTSTINEINNTPQERLGILEKLGYDLFDYDFYKGYLILEESSAERIIREFLIPTFIPELKDKLRTIAAQGTSDVLPKFNDLHRLFLFLHRSEVYTNRAWVIADGDKSGKESVENLRSKFSSWDTSHFINFEKDNFEKYYPAKFKDEVEALSKLKNGKQKQEEKLTFLNSVINWTLSNPKEARVEFEKSAKEVINKLRDIQVKLQSTAFNILPKLSLSVKDTARL
jgi:predicted ATPase